MVASVLKLSRPGIFQSSRQSRSNRLLLTTFLVAAPIFLTACSSDADRLSGLLASNDSYNSPEPQGYAAATQSVTSQALTPVAMESASLSAPQSSYGNSSYQVSSSSSATSFTAPGYGSSASSSYQSGQPQRGQPHYGQPQTSPFYTGSIQKPQSLNQFNTASIAPAQSQPTQSYQKPKPIMSSSGGQGTHAVTASVQPIDQARSQRADTTHTPARASGSQGAIKVQSGDTLYSLARAHQVSVSDLQRANNLSNASHIQVGQTLVLPGHASARTAAPVQTASVSQATTPASRPVIQPQPVQQASHAASNAVTPSPLPVQPKSVTTTPITQNPAIEVVASASPSNEAQQPVKRVQSVAISSAEREQSAQRSLDQIQSHQGNAGQNAVQATQPSAPQQSAAAAPANATPDFRWPIRGRILSEFGKAQNGLQNDGINIAVPEGASIRASEAGEVVYAGNELKGYGNLVLVKHANDWVTAYAHASEILVERGQKVNRGQIVARAGKTGNVDTPQLHFEIRKGSRPVDPMPYLNGLNGQVSSLQN
jgi:murein DD-endopeptidase MepM/ murein hydrolase activator NlpD